MTEIEILKYARAVIYAFEFKKPIKARVMKVREMAKVCQYIKLHTTATIDLEAYLAELEMKQAQARA